MRFLLFTLALISVVSAQTPPPGVDASKAVPVRNLAVCFLFAPSTPEIFYQDARGEYQALRIDTVRFGSWNQVPATKSLPLYRKKTDPKTGRPVYEVSQTWSLPPGNGPVRKLYYYGPAGQILNMDFPTDLDSHQAMQLKAINLLAEPAMIRVGEQTQPMAPKSEIILTAAPGSHQRFSFQFGYQPNGEPSYVSPAANLRFVSANQRLTVLIGYLPVTVTDGSNSNGLKRYDATYLTFFEDVTRLPVTPEPPTTVARR